MSDVKAREISAFVGGKEVRFRISSDPMFLMMFEKQIGAPMEMMRKLLSGQWLPTELMKLLAGALVTVNQSRVPGAMSHPVIDRAFKTNPFGIYVPLGVLILEAFLFGVEPADAHFDEREAMKADGKAS